MDEPLPPPRPPIPPSAPGWSSSHLPTPYVPPDSPFGRETRDTLPDDAVTYGPVGLGGWLVFVSISFVVGIPWLTYHLIHKWNLFFARPEVWQRLATPGSPAYRPLWGTLMIYETAGNAVRLICLVVAAVLFYQRRRLFKPSMIAFQIASVLYLWLDHFLVRQVTTTSSDHVSQLIGQTAGTLLWTSYLLMSQRVKNTFVR